MALSLAEAQPDFFYGAARILIEADGSAPGWIDLGAQLYKDTNMKTLERIITTEDVQRFQKKYPNREATLPALARFIKKDDKRFIQVAMGSGAKPYVFQCPGCKVGDWVVLPPRQISVNGDGSPIYGEPRLGQVSGHGRGLNKSDRPIKHAQRVNSSIVKPKS